MKIALSAHANLWNEANPKMTIDTYHLIVLPKDGGGFKHHAFDTLEREWKTFLLQRELYDMENAKPAKAAKSKPVEKPAKLRIRVKAQSKPLVTMAEILAAFGEVPKVALAPAHGNVDAVVPGGADRSTRQGCSVGGQGGVARIDRHPY
jgi:hypothetical protein